MPRGIPVYSIEKGIPTIPPPMMPAISAREASHTVKLFFDSYSLSWFVLWFSSIDCSFDISLWSVLLVYSESLILSEFKLVYTASLLFI